MRYKMEEDEKVEIGIETAVCCVQHINALLRQTRDEEMADWGEPCSDCRYIDTCKFDWLARIKPLFEKTNIAIKLCRPPHSGK